MQQDTRQPRRCEQIVATLYSVDQAVETKGTRRPQTATIEHLRICDRRRFRFPSSVPLTRRCDEGLSPKLCTERAFRLCVWCIKFYARLTTSFVSSPLRRENQHRTTVFGAWTVDSRHNGRQLRCPRGQSGFRQR